MFHGLLLALALGTSTPLATLDAGWDEGAVRHLLNRAGLGATHGEIARALGEGRERTIERLLHPGPEAATPFSPALTPPSLRGGLVHPRDLAARLDLRRDEVLDVHSDHISPLAHFGDDWLGKLLRGEDPLRDQLTLFWHGHFTSSFHEVGDAHKLSTQIQFLRANALGSFETLVRGIARDPAMLQYLNNNKNVADHPNENWARELLELFTLGDGSYSERDIKEVARAFSGWSDADRRFALCRLEHDDGQKSVFGLTGALDGDHVIDAILTQPACALFVARKLLVFFEGGEPAPARIENYADILLKNGWRIDAFAGQLFRDPEFYRPAIRGARVSSPTEFLLATSRRLALAPPGPVFYSLGDLCGQHIFFPPSVKGWDGGLGWITTGSVLARSNAAGMLLGLVSAEDLVRDSDSAAGDAPELVVESNQARTTGLPMLRYMQRTGWKSEPSLAHLLARALPPVSDEALARALLEELLSLPPRGSSITSVAELLHAERTRAKLDVHDLGADIPATELILRRAAHLALSLPEAQLD